MDNRQQRKWDRLLKGERVICSDDDMDSFPFNERLASIPNPNRVGVLDAWEAFLKLDGISYSR